MSRKILLTALTGLACLGSAPAFGQAGCTTGDGCTTGAACATGGCGEKLFGNGCTPLTNQLKAAGCGAQTACGDEGCSLGRLRRRAAVWVAAVAMASVLPACLAAMATTASKSVAGCSSATTTETLWFHASTPTKIESTCSKVGCTPRRWLMAAVASTGVSAFDGMYGVRCC